MPVLAKPLDELCREGQLITSGQGRAVYTVSYEGIQVPMVVKQLSIPATQTMVSGLIYSGAVADEQAALQYYSTEIEDVKKELALLAPMRNHPNFLPYLDSYIRQKTDGVGYDLYLLTLHATSVRELMEQRSFTYRSALELGVSAASALCALREIGLLHRDIRPENLFRDLEGNFRLGDMGVIPLDDLQYATLPDRYITFCTPPELCDVLGEHNNTVDTYALGMVLWTIFNGYKRPFDGDMEQRNVTPVLPAPEFAPAELAEILCRACAHDPEARYSDPQELKDVLQACLAEADDALILPVTEPVVPPEEPSAPQEAAPVPVAVETASTESAEEPAPTAPQDTLPPAVETPVVEEVAPSDTTEEFTLLPDQTADEQTTPLPELSPRFKAAFAAAYEEEDLFPDDLTTDPSRVRGHRHLWVKILIPILLVAILCAGAFAAVHYLRTRAYVIDQLTLQIEGADTLHVSFVAPEEALLTVNLTDAGGRVLQSLPYQGEDLYFEHLDAGTEYAITLQSQDEHPLEGVLTGRAVTPKPTELLSFEAVALSPTEIALEFSSTGYEPEHWTLTFSNAAGQSQTSSFSGHSLVIEGLNAGESYTFTITDAENQPVLGSSTVTCETETVVNLTTFELDDSVYGELTVNWESTGNFAKSWYLTCAGTDGSYRAETITEQSDSFSYTFEDLPTGIGYEVQLSCEGLTNAADATRTIELPLCTVTDFVAFATGSDSIHVSWSFIDGEQPERWRLVCTNLGTGESDIYSLAENSFEFTGLLPDAPYQFELSAENDLLVGGCSPVTARTQTAEKFDDYKTSGIFLGFFALPNKENFELQDLVTSTRIFSTSGGMAFAVEVSYQYTGADKSVETLYIIRDGDNNIVNYYTGELSWSGSSVKETHFGGFQQCPETPGDYKLELYFNGELLTSKTFTVI